jgi:hypothetical protein
VQLLNEAIVVLRPTFTDSTSTLPPMAYSAATEMTMRYSQSSFYTLAYSGFSSRPGIQAARLRKRRLSKVQFLYVWASYCQAPVNAEDSAGSGEEN